ncbi:MAG: pyrroloquinoline quinone biosynthesis protein PqqB [Acetobacteraceae bacterium]|nr:pyrroloquinoline quinone biosynthesis protein PqqB [Acetobacteraceae bacterium]
MKALVLGSAAGGGFPQWNCACRLCSLAWSGDPRARPRSQASVAVSADNATYVLVGASPDLRQQIQTNPALHPRRPGRESPVIGVILVSADVDGIAGLLVLRERQPFRILAPEPILAVINSNTIFGVLDPALVEKTRLDPAEPIECAGLRVTLLPMPGKVPLYLEERGADLPEAGPSYAAKLEANGRSIVVAPACAEITSEVRAMLRSADTVFFDGTLFTDDEMIAAGVGTKTGRRMGHVPMSGPDGSLALLADLPGRRIYLHINNTNPVLLEDSPERREVEAAGFEIAYDGMELCL